MTWKPIREMRLSDLSVDRDGKPLIGTPLGRRQFVLGGIVAYERYKAGRLLGWYGPEKSQPILEYHDGTMELLYSLSETNWRSL